MIRQTTTRPAGGFCAICIAETADLQPELQDGALVLVCRDCRSEPARAYSSARGYDVPERADRSTKVAPRAAADRPSPPPRRGRQAVVRRKQTPGFLLVLVPLHDPDGRARDLAEARATFAGEPWAAEAHYLGFRRDTHIFERPPSGRYVHQPDPIAPIEKWRVK